MWHNPAGRFCYFPLRLPKAQIWPTGTLQSPDSYGRPGSACQSATCKKSGSAGRTEWSLRSPDRQHLRQDLRPQSQHRDGPGTRVRSHRELHKECKSQTRQVKGYLGGSVSKVSAFGSGHDPGVLRSSPASESLLSRGACFSLCLCLCLSLSLCVTIINK